jgi:hypothetical protein
MKAGETIGAVVSVFAARTLRFNRVTAHLAVKNIVTSRFSIIGAAFII